MNAPDPLGYITVGDPDPTPDEHLVCYRNRGTEAWCTRPPHPPTWQHIAGDGYRVAAVWTDDGPAAEPAIREMRGTGNSHDFDQRTQAASSDEEDTDELGEDRKSAIDAYAAEHNLSRAEAVRRLIDAGLIATTTSNQETTT